MPLAWESVLRARRRGLASLCEAAQCSHWVVRRSVAEVSALRADGGIVIQGGAEPRPYTRSNVPCERPLPLPLGEVAERSEDGEGKQ